MDNNLTLVIMAAGMGSRFGGLKQIEKVGPSGEFIIDYSIYDAKNAGFNKVVFIIKEENYDVFKETIGKRVEDKIDVEYVFQRLNDIPNGYTLPTDRTKPLGTSQAILACKNVVNTPFAIINADDYYGADAYIKAAEFLKESNNDSNDYGMIAYQIKNTMTVNGAVKRGICHENNDYLTDIIESSVDYNEKSKLIASPLENNREPFEIAEDEMVSMNMFLLTPTIFKHIEDNFAPFLDENKDNLDKCEYLIPILLDKLLKEGIVTIKVIKTTAMWYGITYKEDLDTVKDAINDMVENKVYSKSLWK